MKINFFETNCNEEPRKDIYFGLCDDLHLQNFPAYSDLENEEKWIATVYNPTEKVFLLTIVLLFLKKIQMIKKVLVMEC